MRAWGALALAFACGVACREPAEPLVFPDAASSDAARLTCPDGKIPTLPDASAACPPTPPVPGSCCPLVGVRCSYPVGDAGHLASGCVDDGVHAPFWSEDTAPAADDAGCGEPAGPPLSGGDSGSCATRPSKPCNITGAQSQQGALDAQILDLVWMCHGEGTGESGIEVWFQDGCATNLTEYGFPGLDVSCLAAGLETTRWQCALGLECGGYAVSTLQ